MSGKDTEKGFGAEVDLSGKDTEKRFGVEADFSGKDTEMGLWVEVDNAEQMKPKKSKINFYHAATPKSPAPKTYF